MVRGNLVTRYYADANYFPINEAIDGSIESIYMSTKKLTSIGPQAFRHCSNLKTVYCDYVQYIYESAFRECFSLTTVTFPSLLVMRSYAFWGCYNLISVYLPGSSVVSFSTRCFSSTPILGYTDISGRLGSIYVPAELLEQYKTKYTGYSERFASIA